MMSAKLESSGLYNFLSLVMRPNLAAVFEEDFMTKRLGDTVVRNQYRKNCGKSHYFLALTQKIENFENNCLKKNLLFCSDFSRFPKTIQKLEKKKLMIL